MSAVPRPSDGDVPQASSVSARRWRGVSADAADRHDAVDDERGGTTVRLRVATYNVLSDNYLRDGKYAYCPAELRYMSSRHERIVAEIRHMQPDVICLQVYVSLAPDFHRHVT